MGQGHETDGSGSPLGVFSASPPDRREYVAVRLVHSYGPFVSKVEQVHISNGVSNLQHEGLEAA